MFSIKVASVIGSFNEVPKQAQSISVLLAKVLITPKEVIDKTNNVIERVTGRFHPIKKLIPKAVSRKGYKFAYNGIFFANGS